MVKYLNFPDSFFALRYFLMLKARPQCHTPFVCLGGRRVNIKHFMFGTYDLGLLYPKSGGS
jgi:hypothetical protein